MFLKFQSSLVSDIQTLKVDYDLIFFLDFTNTPNQQLYMYWSSTLLAKCSRYFQGQLC